MVFHVPESMYRARWRILMYHLLSENVNLVERKNDGYHEAQEQLTPDY